MVAFARIDERLLHGQIAVKWTSEVKATDIVIIDDETAASPPLTKMFIGLAPQGVNVTVTSVEEAASKLLAPELAGENSRAFLLAKTPAPYLHILRAGVALPSLNIGNMLHKASRKRYLRYFYADEEEVGQLKQIMDLGVDCFCQMIPDAVIGEGKKSLKKVLKIK